MQMIETVKGLCLPALIYLILAIVQIIASILYRTSTIIGTVVGIVILILWTWLLNYICKAGYEVVSWILVFLPIILTIVVFIFLANFMKNLSKEDKKTIINEIKKSS